ncbi:MAG: hypothetical protein Q8M92_07420, partial [Candidatus Subteraquimicrobiales bacterium]|nr:hypothetical protein [Candidatus Subteraquimicrobiales bacterium]
RAKIESIEAQAGSQVIRALTPLAEMFGYATRLRSLTQGRAIFTMQFDRYEKVPPNISREIISKIQGELQLAASH